MTVVSLTTTTPALPARATGDYDVLNWNEYQPTGGTRGAAAFLTGTDLYTSTLAATTEGFTVNYDNADNTGSTGSNINGQHNYSMVTGTANDLLLGGGIDSSAGTLTLTLTGLSATADYTIITYVSSLYFAAPAVGSVSDGASTFYYKPTNGTGLTSFVQGTATTEASAEAANYVEFDGVTGLTTQVLTIADASADGGLPALMAFQIIEVPEPSTYALLGLACAGVFLVVRRRTVRV
jgi:hypothetical protein